MSRPDTGGGEIARSSYNFKMSKFTINDQITIIETGNLFYSAAFL